MRGAGLDVSKAAELITSRYMKFGEVSQDVSKQILQVSKASAETGINIEIAQNQIVQASEPLAIFGRKSGESAKLWATFTNALKNKIPIQEVGKLVQRVTKSMADMNLQSRAFISQMSGMAQGAGALGGALKMELAMRGPGGLKRNMQALTQTLARFGGGRVITLQQAAENPALQMQFQLQRQMVGQLTGVQGGQAQARVLEVLQKMQSGGISQLDASKTLKDLTATGSKAQEASLTALDRIATIISAGNSILTGISATDAVMSRYLKTISNTLVGPRGSGPSREQIKDAGTILREAAKDTISEFDRQLSKIGESFLSSFQKTPIGARPRVKGIVEPRAPGTPFTARNRPGAETAPSVRARPAIVPRTTNVRTAPPRRDIFGVPGGLSRLIAPNRAGDLRRGIAAVRRTAEEGAPPARPITTAAGGTTPGAVLATARETPIVPDAITVKVTCEQCGHKLGQKIEKIIRGQIGAVEPGSTYA